MRQPRIVAAAVAVCLLAACSPQAEPTPTPAAPTSSPSAVVASPTTNPTQTDASTPTPSPSKPPTPSPTPPPSQSPTGQSTLSPDQQEAVEAVEKFFRIYDATVKDPNYSLQELADITDGQARADLTELVDRLRTVGHYRSGIAVVTVFQVDPVETKDGTRMVRVYSCLDSSRTTTMDVKTKKPAMPDPKVPYTKWMFEVAKLDGWRLVDGGNKKVGSCG